MNIDYKFDPKRCSYRLGIVRYITDYKSGVNYDLIYDQYLNTKTEEEAHQLANLLQAEEYEIKRIKNFDDSNRERYYYSNELEIIFVSPRLKEARKKDELLRAQREMSWQEECKKRRAEFLDKPSNEVVFTTSNGTKLILTRSISQFSRFNKTGEYTSITLQFDDDHPIFWPCDYLTKDGKILKKQLTKYLSDYHKFTGSDCELFFAKFKSICQIIKSENDRAV